MKLIGDLQSNSPYIVRISENTDKKDSELWQSSRSVHFKHLKRQIIKISNFLKKSFSRYFEEKITPVVRK